MCSRITKRYLTSAIAKISGGKILNGKNEIELGINAESIRFIATIVIFYNAQLLCRLYEYFFDKDQKKARMIAQMSPVAWQYLSFLGKYEFCNKDKSINIQKVIEILLVSAENDISLSSQT
ncbi:hypothetical protein CKY01_22205 [Photorhabdus laumondii subsp. clarkei]|uniref:Tn3 transposase DDE domain-containing protein n=1 Tax=Photorhabdus laumondii subsp. clarkei TaxID=2029685 RepID=A0A329VCN2_9GAMM|nr:Tn3 family transposase [Photorhabdus laumondii]RAW82226.1 hypothetical protein CKY01_22205 [Photorhabdus laumondii subsp. clarkei]